MSKIPDLIKTRLTKEREQTPITLRIPVDVLESLKVIAPLRGFSGYQALLKAYVSDGLRRDEAEYLLSKAARLKAALIKQGVAADVIERAEKEVA